ncbi:MAG: hypothetical protein IJ859_03900 [Synergistaceae bacterium]|nr:hypothetical protein [Synergistaceae bacterium]
MALPLLVGAAALGLLGAAGHSVAKETNEKAQRIANEAQGIYNKAKSSLESAKNNAMSSARKLDEHKKEVLQNSMARFLKSFDRVKHIQLDDTPGLEEIKKFSIKPADALQLRNMTEIDGNFGSGTAGIATGVALTSLAGLGAFTLPGLSIIAGPVVFFTAFSASTKADENLEKAQTMYAEAEAAVSKMKTSETLCNAIKKRSEMFDTLLQDCNEYFAMATAKLEEVISKRAGFLGAMSSKPIPAEKFTKEDKDIMAVAFSLAGTVKAVIYTPILSKNGNLEESSERKYHEITRALSSSKEEIKAIGAGTVKPSHVAAIKAGEPMRVLNIPQAIIGALMLLFFARYFYVYAEDIASMNYFILKTFAVGFIGLIGASLTLENRDSILKIAIYAFLSLMFAFSVGALIFGVLSWLGLYFIISIVIAEAVALFLSFVLFDMATNSK